MDKGAKAQFGGRSRRLNVNGNQFPDERWLDGENVLTVLDEPVNTGGRNGTLYQAPNDDVLQLFDAPSIKRRHSGLLPALPPAEPQKVVALSDYQKQSGEQVNGEAAQPRQVSGEYLAPPTNPSQRNQARRATAKLDYYKKLAELQQMNLEFGRSIRVARGEANGANGANGNGHTNGYSNGSANHGTRTEAPTQAVRREGTHPLSASFHVATKRSDARPVPAPPAPSKQPVPHPLPANQQRVTAKLDYNRLLEFQRRYEEAQTAELPPGYSAGLTIEDRLAGNLAQRQASPEFGRETVRIIDPQKPRLPVRDYEATRPVEATAREWQNTPAHEAVVRRQQTEIAPPVASQTHNQPAHYQPAHYQGRYQTGNTGKLTGGLQRSQAQAPVAERVREVLLDPTRIDPHLIALSDFNPRAARYFDQVAVSLISVSYKRLCKRVLIASALHGEGRTCVALNLAGALARARQRVLVVDCDLANPSVLRLLGIDAPLGLNEAVHRGLGPNAVALRVQPAAFNILPAREKVQHTAELLASPRFHEMLQLCEPDYDFILFDSSPLLESADANLLAGLTDATMLVIRPGMTTTQQMAKAVSLFNEKDICGVVLNRVVK